MQNAPPTHSSDKHAGLQLLEAHFFAQEAFNLAGQAPFIPFEFFNGFLMNFRRRLRIRSISMDLRSTSAGVVLQMHKAQRHGGFNPNPYINI